MRAFPFRSAGTLWLVLMIIGAGCSTYSSRQVLDPRPAAERLAAGGGILEEVDRLARPLIENGEVSSLVVGVLTPDGAARSFGYGAVAHDNLQSPGGDTIFDIGSLTKLFVAATLAVLVEEGELSYSDTVRSILPAHVKVSDEAGRITLHDLVTHQSGIPRQPQTMQQMHYVMDYVVTGRNPYRFIDRNYVYKFLRSCRVPPRNRRTYNYSNLAYGVLGHLMELKTGRSLPELVDEKICRPLNLRDTGFTLSELQRTRFAEGHVGDQPKLWRRHTPMRPWDMGEVMRASGGMYSTTHDLMIFARSNLGLLGHPLDRVLASTQHVELKTDEEDVAFGWVINRFDEWSTSITYMNGFVSGYSAYLGMDTQRRIGVVVLYSNFNWEEKVGHNLVLRLAAARREGRLASALPAESK